MMAQVFAHLTPETRRTPSGNHKREYVCLLRTCVVKILFERETYEA
jgi:hypothetical protein